MSAMASLAECRLLRTQATDTGQTAIGPGADMTQIVSQCADEDRGAYTDAVIAG